MLCSGQPVGGNTVQFKVKSSCDTQIPQSRCKNKKLTLVLHPTKSFNVNFKIFATFKDKNSQEQSLSFIPTCVVSSAIGQAEGIGVAPCLLVLLKPAKTEWNKKPIITMVTGQFSPVAPCCRCRFPDEWSFLNAFSHLFYYDSTSVCWFFCALLVTYILVFM